MLANPWGAPDHTSPANWTSSAQPSSSRRHAAHTELHGMEGTRVQFPRRGERCCVGPTIDIDRDGLSNAAEYALGA